MSDFEQAVADKVTAPAPAEGKTFESAAETPAPKQPVITALSNGSVVIDGKVYEPEAAAKKIQHADKHIETLERENAEKDAATLALIARIEALEKNRNHKDALDELVASAPSAPVAPPPEQPPTQEVSKEELVQAAVDTIEGQRVAATQQSNLDTCVALAQEIYGDDYGNKIDSAGTKYGMSMDDVVEMARNKPSVFKKLFLSDAGPKGIPDTTGSSVGGDIGQGVHKAVPKKRFLNMSAKQRTEYIKNRMSELNANSGN